MTLFRQINSLLFGLFLIVMSCLVYFQFTQTRDFMSHQISSDLNNTSTSLGLMLRPHLETGDMVGAETLINVLFEGGFYRKVSLTWLVDGKEQTWENPVVIKDVPLWFVDLDLFRLPTKETVITSGWMQLAKLKIEGHPALGYQELWRVMNDTLMILSLLFLGAIFILRLRLNSILKPLHQVSVHAKEIAEQKFSGDMELPKTTELKDVVGAINSMSRQLKKVFHTLDSEVSKLKNDNLVDSVSNLPNRQYLSGQITSWLDEPSYGGLILAKFDWLDEIHSKYGYQVRDETIGVLAKKFQAELPKIAETVIARIANTEFAFLITKSEHQQIEIYLQSLIRLINQEMSKAGCSPNTNYSLGVSERRPNSTLSNLLAQSDNALQQALQSNKISVWFGAQEQQKYSREQWRCRLIDAIRKNQFVFQWQPILDTETGEIIQREIYCRLVIDDVVVMASQFMRYIELLSLGSQLDKCLIETMAKQDIFKMVYEPIAINLSDDSLLDGKFHQWLELFLKQTPHPERIHFEVSESGGNSNFEQCQKLAELIRNCGAKFGVDHCGRQMGSLDYLQKLRPHYIKLDQSFAFYGKSAQNNELCRALVNVAKGLGIEVVITAIEDEAQLQRFRSLSTEGYQGYISPPQDIPT